MVIKITLVAVAATSIGVLSTSAGLAANARKVGGWSIEQKSDPMTDDAWVIAQTEAGDAGGMWLQIRCEEKLAYIAIGITGVDFPSGSEVPVALRIDGGAPTQSLFSGLGEAGALVSKLSRQTYAKVLTAKTIAFKANRGASDWTAAFRPARTEQALRPLKAACPLSGQADSSQRSTMVARRSAKPSRPPRSY